VLPNEWIEGMNLMSLLYQPRMLLPMMMIMNDERGAVDEMIDRENHSTRRKVVAFPLCLYISHYLIWD
jgi:hypothetical protein